MRAAQVKLEKRHIVLRCDTKEENFNLGDLVVVETKEGPQMGRVISEPQDLNTEIFSKPTPPVIRLATDEDRKKQEEEEKKAAEAMKKCKEKAEQLALPMKVVGVDFQSGGEKVTFFFTAETRINFRELVKQLASEFHARIEMRQIGARNEAKMMGGVGCCGLPLCCVSFLPDFEPVTIRMAKDQGLSLDPTKISGLCGRLLCCLEYEASTYSEFLKDLPKCGCRIATSSGEGKVIKQNVLAKTLLVDFDDGQKLTIKAEEIKKKAP
jgi:cell fate regulator YaaT (PSP1 superfamily)